MPRLHSWGSMSWRVRLLLACGSALWCLSAHAQDCQDIAGVCATAPACTGRRVGSACGTGKECVYTGGGHANPGVCCGCIPIPTAQGDLPTKITDSHGNVVDAPIPGMALRNGLDRHFPTNNVHSTLIIF